MRERGIKLLTRLIRIIIFKLLYNQNKRRCIYSRGIENKLIKKILKVKT